VPGSALSGTLCVCTILLLFAVFSFVLLKFTSQFPQTCRKFPGRSATFLTYKQHKLEVVKYAPKVKRFNGNSRNLYHDEMV
jgi:hypothetical protein